MSLCVSICASNYVCLCVCVSVPVCTFGVKIQQPKDIAKDSCIPFVHACLWAFLTFAISVTSSYIWKRCPKSCATCKGECADVLYTGFGDENGLLLPCEYLGANSFCTHNDYGALVTERCCSSCTITTDTTTSVSTVMSSVHTHTHTCTHTLQLHTHADGCRHVFISMLCASSSSMNLYY